MKTKLGLIILALYIAIAAVGAVMPAEETLNLSLRLQPVFTDFFLGSDENGASLALQAAKACWLSASLSLLVILISGAMGTTLGLTSGLKGGFVDTFLMRLTEVIQAFPNFLLALCLLAALGPSFFNLLLAMTLTTWVGFARIVRNETLHLKTLEFVEASKGFGAKDSLLAIKHILPQMRGLLLVHASYSLAGVVIAEAGLSFLGLGLPPEVPSWGQLINRGTPFLSEAPHITLVPSALLAGFVLAFYLIGDGLKNRS